MYRLGCTFVYMTNNTQQQNAIQCTADHGRILVGYAGGSDALGSFGSFIAEQPVGAEILSMSGRVAVWTGNYVLSPNGHRAAVLRCVDRPELGDILIHTCLGNVWNATGR